ncbi:MAG TPA: hypothetical protein VLB45_05265 [Nitrosopumilaceae archaeon]|nr:hypothetical protein [Nitrosopumilaceae archaeon]
MIDTEYHYFDDEGNNVSKDLATKVEIITKDEDGLVIHAELVNIK